MKKILKTDYELLKEEMEKIKKSNNYKISESEDDE